MRNVVSYPEHAQATFTEAFCTPLYTRLRKPDQQDKPSACCQSTEQNQNTNHTYCWDRDAKIRPTHIPLHCARPPRPHQGRRHPAKCQQTQMTWHRATTEEPVWSGQPPWPPSHTAQHRGQQHALSWVEVEAREDASPAAAPSAFPPSSSGELHPYQREEAKWTPHGLDPSVFSWDRDTAWGCRPEQVLLARERAMASPERLGLQAQLWGLSHPRRVPQLLRLPPPN